MSSNRSVAGFQAMRQCTLIVRVRVSKCWKKIIFYDVFLMWPDQQNEKVLVYWTKLANLLSGKTNIWDKSRFFKPIGPGLHQVRQISNPVYYMSK